MIQCAIHGNLPGKECFKCDCDTKQKVSEPEIVKNPSPFIRDYLPHPLPTNDIGARDYFAAHCPILFQDFLAGWPETSKTTVMESLKAYSEFRFLYADCMMRVRHEKH